MTFVSKHSSQGTSFWKWYKKPHVNQNLAKGRAGVSGRKALQIKPVSSFLNEKLAVGGENNYYAFERVASKWY